MSTKEALKAEIEKLSDKELEELLKVAKQSRSGNGMVEGKIFLKA